MPSGQVLLDFGAFPGASDATVAITGQTAILSTSLVEAWIFPVATSDHSVDEQMVETIKVLARDVIAGTGFTIGGVNTSQLDDPFGNGTRLYGKFNCGWVWT